jgi:hypothetical protein
MRIRPVHADELRAIMDPAEAIRKAAAKGEPVFYARCKVCNERHISLHLLADLDGEPFTYYCRAHAPHNAEEAA